MENREQWGSRVGFILAAIGSAIGLGNIWRFPYVAYENGGGAFLIPYLFALLTAGIPILILEFGVGRSKRGSAPLSFSRLSKRFEWLGWFQTFLSFGIITFYSVIIAWSINYMIFSFNLKWGDDPEAFFYGDKFLNLTEISGFNLGGIQWHIFIPLIFVWIALFFIISRGIKKGIEKLSLIFMPILLVLMVIIVLRAIFLPGALEGLNHLFTPNFDYIVPWGSNPDWGQVWIAAYGQIFFSLSIAFAIMITYSSYLPKDKDVNNSAFITAFSNSGFSFLAAIGVFAAIGFMANQANTEVSEVATAGLGLAFVAFPQIISEFPAFNEFFGVLFFLTLVVAGFTSAISIIEVVVSSIMDKLKVSRTKATAWICLIGFFISLIFITGTGLYFFDTLDHFINSFGIVISGFVELILLGWFIKLATIREENNLVSDFKIGYWWDIMIKVVTPIMLLIMIIINFRSEFSGLYGGYPLATILIFGWGALAIMVVVAAIMTGMKWKDSQEGIR
ncbi:sodium-dependent transporter [Chengkuizengella sediminis]|uniref:sodium-dependent transporter n=1 Tax=Chengkuizengella sediminis TaxID=1885917 RepID=UPI0013897D26|nr:sodium-dependent transporter [Chengkuizengella sediminis]NDI36368.1 sodium-dependent transporter [Chengkuizengella sediminis]